jgi:hypothetical protein
MGTEMLQRICVKTTEYTVQHIIYCIVYIYFYNFMNSCKTDITTWDLVFTKFALLLFTDLLAIYCLRMAVLPKTSSRKHQK